MALPWPLMVAEEASIVIPRTVKSGDVPVVKGPLTVTVVLAGSRSMRVATTLPLPAGLSKPRTSTVSPTMMLLRLNFSS